MHTVFKCIYECPGDTVFEVIQQWTVRLHFCSFCALHVYRIVIRKTVINRIVMRNMVVMINERCKRSTVFKSILCVVNHTTVSTKRTKVYFVAQKQSFHNLHN